jgi:hypothetical protein
VVEAAVPESAFVPGEVLRCPECHKPFGEAASVIVVRRTTDAGERGHLLHRCRWCKALLAVRVAKEAA